MVVESTGKHGFSWVKDVGRFFGLGKGQRIKEAKHEQHVQNIRSLKGTNKKIFNRLRNEAYSSSKWDRGQKMRKQNEMYDSIFRQLEKKNKQNKVMADQAKQRAKRGNKGFKEQGAKKLTIDRKTPGKNVSSGTGRYSETGRRGYDSLKLSGGSNL